MWVKWDEKALNLSREDCFKALSPAPLSSLRTPMGITLVPWMMVPGQEHIVAQRLREVLEARANPPAPVPPAPTTRSYLSRDPTTLSRAWYPAFTFSARSNSSAVGDTVVFARHQPGRRRGQREAGGGHVVGQVHR